jgi:hypothetical protein
MIDNRHLFQAVSAKGGVAAVVWCAQALYALAIQARRPEERYWVFRGQKRDFYICARPGCHRCTALCVFDSERAARESLRTLSEPRMFLSTLEFYGASMPSWVREERLLSQVSPLTGRPSSDSFPVLRATPRLCGIQSAARGGCEPPTPPPECGGGGSSVRTHRIFARG